MNYFLAVNDRQLGTCLRMLFAEKLQPAVQTVGAYWHRGSFYFAGKRRHRFYILLPNRSTFVLR